MLARNTKQILPFQKRGEDFPSITFHPFSACTVSFGCESRAEFQAFESFYGFLFSNNSGEKANDYGFTSINYLTSLSCFHSSLDILF